MRELNKKHVYSLEELTSEEWELLKPVLNENSVRKFRYDTLEGNFRDGYRYIFFNITSNWVFIHNDDAKNYSDIVNAKELFYTLENVQVDCRELSEEQIKEMCEVFIKNGYDYYNTKSYALKTDYKCVFMQCDEDGFLIDSKEDYKHTITYEKFMELFAEQPKEETVLQPHYDNTNGSIYKFCNDQKLNAWEFDIIKRVVRCRKKGLFKEDLQKTKDLIDLYLKEFTDEN